MREAAIIKNDVPVNVIVLADGEGGDRALTQYAEMGITCVEITGLAPKPGLGNGWHYIDGEWVAPQPPNVE